MLQALLLAAAVGQLAAALPQGIDFAAVNAMPTPAVQGPPATGIEQVPTYKTEAAAASAAAAASSEPIVDAKRSVVARDACSPQPAGAGPTTSPDTADAFLANSAYDQIAQNAAVPQGYSQAFSDLHGSVEGNGYMGYYTLQSYDTVKCQQYCDAAQGCTAFNVFLERDPSQDPASTCPNPASTVNIKCTLWGLPVSNTTATNAGQWRNDFHVVIAASNGYIKNAPPAAQANFTGPTELPGAIQAPNGYIGQSSYAGPYDPSQCAAACQTTTQYDHDHPRDDGTYDACNFFVAYIISKNNSPLGTYCNYYTKAWDRSYATNTGQYDGDGNYYSVSSAYSYTLAQQDPGVVSSS